MGYEPDYETTTPGATVVRPISPSEESENAGAKLSAVQASALQVAETVTVAQFRGRPVVLETDPFPHYVPLHRETFNRIAYPVLGGVTRSRMSDVFAYLGSMARDLTGNDHLIGFGDRVWNMRKVGWVESSFDDTIWRCPYPAIDVTLDDPVEFVMQLAGGDQDVYDDIMQSLAPLVMDQKPDGVIWWVGAGANGKSTLMDAIYRLFPGQLSSINVKRLTDGRDTPSLNGTLANVVKESSEGRIEDTEIYKSVATHENFRVHKFHSQDDIEIIGNLHHIFSANSIQAFNDKGFSARRRTFIIPFNERFTSDPTFEQRVFTPEMFGRLIVEMCRYAVKVKNQGYRYKWSAITLGAKEEYDTEANSAEEYAKQLVSDGVVGFDSFLPVKMDYENWCAENGYVPLGVGNMRRAVQAAGFERLSTRGGTGEHSPVFKRYRLPGIEGADMVTFSMSRPGFFTVPGFTAPEPVVDNPEVDERVPEQPEPESNSILKGKW